jgi:ring-1,2-phenylacetyl-CoA epoxidase subunit PaaD
MSSAASASPGTREERIWQLLGAVPDPEIPVLSIVDLGIVRHVRCDAHGRMTVGLTPTYSGCPATEAIRAATRAALDAHGEGDVCLEEVLSPPWSSDWLSAQGQQKLREFGIAPPQGPVTNPRQLWGATGVTCPRCGSHDSERLSEFGSTPCKAHYRCIRCREPFDYFKCI